MYPEETKTYRMILEAFQNNDSTVFSKNRGIISACVLNAEAIIGRRLREIEQEEKEFEDYYAQKHVV